MSDLIKREDVLNVLRAFGWTPSSEEWFCADGEREGE